MTWVLIVHIFASKCAESDLFTSVPGFRSEAACAQAGERMDVLVRGTHKKIRFVCVSQP